MTRGSFLVSLLAATAMASTACAPSESSRAADSPVAAARDTGVAADSASLLEMNHGMTLQGGEWIVRAIGSAPASDSARATMRFGEDGRITGNTTCNSYSASYTTARLQITIMQVVSTKRACVAERLMEQERRFLDLLQRATTWKIHGDSTLTLAAPTGEAITAKR